MEARDKEPEPFNYGILFARYDKVVRLVGDQQKLVTQIQYPDAEKYAKLFAASSDMLRCLRQIAALGCGWEIPNCECSPCRAAGIIRHAGL
jgi:hypothetical protein